jgi:hypothetical protein
VLPEPGFHSTASSFVSAVPGARNHFIVFVVQKERRLCAIALHQPAWSRAAREPLIDRLGCRIVSLPPGSATGTPDRLISGSTGPSPEKELDELACSVSLAHLFVHTLCFPLLTIRACGISHWPIRRHLFFPLSLAPFSGCLPLSS